MHILNAGVHWLTVYNTLLLDTLSKVQFKHKINDE